MSSPVLLRKNEMNIGVYFCPITKTCAWCLQISSPPAAVFVPQVQRELLNRMTGEGLAVTYRFTRTVSIFSPKMIAIEILFTNHSDAPIEHIKLHDSVSLQPRWLQARPKLSAVNLVTQAQGFAKYHTFESVTLKYLFELHILVQLNLLHDMFL
jgi:hypothetical protein